MAGMLDIGTEVLRSLLGEVPTGTRGLLDAPVGTSTMQRVSNPSPDVSPLARSAYMTPEQKLGRFWNAATGRAKTYTNADLPALTAAGQEAYDAAMGFAGQTTPIRAFHGSPHTFDRFDLSKIGTGEGAQAYGHGLYFAGNEGVARGYRDALKFRGLVDPKAPATDPRRIAGELFESWQGDITGALGDAKFYDNSRAIIAELRKIGANPPTGSMYEVSLRTTPERLLDWDKPLNRQAPSVQEAVRQASPKIGAEMDMWLARQREVLGPDAVPLPIPIQGQQVVERLSQGRHGARAAERLREAGLDGIQYLDAGSRAAGDGSRNYVMFRDDIIDILRRYGLLGMLGGGAAAVGAEQ